MNFTKAGKSSEARQKYMREVVFEILSGTPKQSATAKAMDWGKDIEQYAREAYETKTGEFATIAEFQTHKDMQFVGSSPDFLIGEDGGAEIKCPHDEGKHVLTLLNGMPEEHMAQIQGNMFVTGRNWWDFVSYDPRQAEPYRIYIQRIERDDIFIEKLREELLKFWKEVALMVTQIKGKATK